MMVRVLSDRSMNIDPLVRVLYFVRDLYFGPWFYGSP